MTNPEVFRFLAHAWNIDEGLRLSADYPVRQADITVLAGFASLIRVDASYLDHVDLTRPILVAPIPGAGNLVIDGWHRIHRALRDGLTVLPARTLSEADEKKIRIY